MLLYTEYSIDKGAAIAVEHSIDPDENMGVCLSSTISTP